MIDFSFTQIQSALIAFVTDIESKLKTYIDDIPVFVLQTGDTSYVMDTKFKENTVKEIYENIPRFVITFSDIDHSSDTDTNTRNRYNYLFNNKVKTAIIRRMEIRITAQCTMVSSNFIKGLENLEILLAIFGRENVFTYEFAGSTFDAGYSCQNSTDIHFPEMENGTRNFTQSLNITIQLHIYLPRIDRIEDYVKDTVFRVEINSDTPTIDNIEKKDKEVE